MDVKPDRNVDRLRPAALAVLDKDTEARREYVEFLNPVIAYPEFDRLLGRMVAAFERAPLALPSLTLISGAPGIGKTTLLSALAKHGPSHDDGHKTITPILYVTLPPEGTKTQILLRILETLGQIPASRGTPTHLLTMTYNTLRAAGVRTLILDEIQHAFGVVSANQQAVNLNLIKDLSNSLRFPIVISGLYKACNRIFEFDQQLQWRIHRIETLKPWSYSEDLANFLEAFEQTLPLRRNSDLGSDHMTYAVASICNGSTGNIVRTLREATKFEIGSRERITLDTFKEMGLKSQPDIVTGDSLGDDARA